LRRKHPANNDSDMPKGIPDLDNNHIQIEVWKENRRRHEVHGARRDQCDVGPVRQRNVLRVLGFHVVPQGGVDRIARQRLQGQGRNKFLGAVGHDDADTGA